MSFSKRIMELEPYYLYMNLVAAIIMEELKLNSTMSKLERDLWVLIRLAVTESNVDLDLKMRPAIGGQKQKKMLLLANMIGGSVVNVVRWDRVIIRLGKEKCIVIATVVEYSAFNHKIDPLQLYPPNPGQYGRVPLFFRQ